MRRAAQAVNGFALYAMTAGTPAIASSSATVPDAARATEAAA